MSSILFFELDTILRQVHKWPHKWPYDHYKVKSPFMCSAAAIEACFVLHL